MAETFVSKTATIARTAMTFMPKAPQMPAQTPNMKPAPPVTTAGSGNAVSANLSGQVKAQGQAINMNKGGGNITPNIEKQWYKSTFDNVRDSIKFHFEKHGAGRTVQEYTDDASQFFKDKNGIIKEVTLKDNTQGVQIKHGVQGGYYKPDGRIVTYWDKL